MGISSGNDESGSDHNSAYSLFSISINLTAQGVLHLEEVINNIIKLSLITQLFFFEVIASVYSYLRMLNKMGPQERIFKEIQLVEETSFKFTEEEDAVDMVEELAESMQVYPSEYYLAGSELYFEYDPKVNITK